MVDLATDTTRDPEGRGVTKGRDGRDGPARAPEETHRGTRAARARRRDEEALEAREAFKNFFKVLIRRRWLVLAIFALCIGVGAVYTFTQTPIYRATCRVLIEPDVPRGPFADVYEQPLPATDFYETQYQLMRSSRIAAGVAAALDIQDTGNPAVPGPLASFEDRVYVNPVRGTRLVDVGYEHPDAAFSALVTGALVNAYIEDNRARRQTTSSALMQHLTDEVHRIEPQLQDVAQRLARFRTEHQIFDPQQQEEILGRRLESISDAYTTAQVEAVKAEAEYELLRADRERQGQGFDPVTIQGDATYATFLHNYVEAQAHLAQISEIYAESHPLRRAAEIELAGIEGILRTYQAQALEGYRVRSQMFTTRAERLGELLDEQKREVLSLEETDLEHRLLQDENERLMTLHNTLLQRIREIDVTASPGGGASNIFVIDPARVPGQPARPRVDLNLIVAALVGLALGIGAALVAEFLDETLKAKEDIEAALEIPVLGAVPRIEAEPAGATVLVEPSSADSESFRAIRTAIALSASAGWKSRVLLVTSADPGDGKSITSTNLSLSFATGGERVLLIDADLRKPWDATLGRVLGVEAGASGLAQALEGGADVPDIQQAVRTSVVSGLDVLPSGDLPDRPNELLLSPRFKAFVDSVRESYERIVIDVPPILAFADAAALSVHADGVIFVVRSEKTLRRHAELALDHLRQVGARVLGVVANQVDVPLAAVYGYGRYGYAYGYRYRYGYGRHGGRGKSGDRERSGADRDRREQ